MIEMLSRCRNRDSTRVDSPPASTFSAQGVTFFHHVTGCYGAMPHKAYASVTRASPERMAMQPAPKAPRERRVTQKALRRFLGEPRHADWKKILATAQVEGGRREALSARECERVMRAWFQRLGEFRMRRWKTG